MEKNFQLDPEFSQYNIFLKPLLTSKVNPEDVIIEDEHQIGIVDVESYKKWRCLNGGSNIS